MEDRVWADSEDFNDSECGAYRGRALHAGSDIEDRKRSLRFHYRTSERVKEFDSLRSRRGDRGHPRDDKDDANLLIGVDSCLPDGLLTDRQGALLRADDHPVEVAYSEGVIEQTVLFDSEYECAA